MNIISVGEKMPAWVNEGTQSYLQRIRGNSRANLLEVSAKKRSKNADITRVLQHEGEAILKHVSSDTRLICLDRPGKAYDSMQVANKIRDWQQLGQPVAFAIGGPEGLNPAVMQRADEIWTLSKMTFTHHVARVMLAEQLYRAWSITEGLPYHR